MHPLHIFILAFGKNFWHPRQSSILSILLASTFFCLHTVAIYLAIQTTINYTPVAFTIAIIFVKLFSVKFLSIPLRNHLIFDSQPKLNIITNSSSYDSCFFSSPQSSNFLSFYSIYDNFLFPPMVLPNIMILLL